MEKNNQNTLKITCDLNDLNKKITKDQSKNTWYFKLGDHSKTLKMSKHTFDILVKNGVRLERTYIPQNAESFDDIVKILTVNDHVFVKKQDQ